MKKVKFGNYWQTDDKNKEAIEWEVLAKENGKALLISKYALDCKPYHENSCSITWENCTLRKWLNSEFINNAFSEEEQQIIALTKNDNPNNSRYGSIGGNATEDKVFLLSIGEANKYLTRETRKCTPTPYAKYNNAWYGDYGFCRWWLRSLGYDQHYAAYVDFEGDVIRYGIFVNYVSNAIRVAMWVDSSKLEL